MSGSGNYSPRGCLYPLAQTHKIYCLLVQSRSVFPLAATPVLSSGGERNCGAGRGCPRIVAMPATSIHTMAVSVFSCQLRVWFVQKGAWGIVVLRGLGLRLEYHDDRGPGPLRAAILGSDCGTDHSTLTALHLQENHCGPADRGSSWPPGSLLWGETAQGWERGSGMEGAGASADGNLCRGLPVTGGVRVGSGMC